MSFLPSFPPILFLGLQIMRYLMIIFEPVSKLTNHWFETSLSKDEKEKRQKDKKTKRQKDKKNKKTNKKKERKKRQKDKKT